MNPTNQSAGLVPGNHKGINPPLKLVLVSKLKPVVRLAVGFVAFPPGGVRYTRGPHQIPLVTGVEEHLAAHPHARCGNDFPQPSLLARRLRHVKPV